MKERREKKEVREMKKIEEVAREVGIEPGVFCLFMDARFPGETDPVYIATWAQRFKTGNPIAFMDHQSVACYIEAVKEYDTLGWCPKGRKEV